MASNLTFTLDNYQSQSPLFGVLSGEIRNEIFALALLQYEDDEEAYPKDSYWYRPGFSGPRKSCSALLRTCKLAYAEGRQVFLSQLEWAFWFDRGPDGRTGNHACGQFFQALAPRAAQALKHVRFFTQMYWLEGGDNINKMFSINQFRPTTLTITIRYSDWWFWEQDEPLRMDEDWLACFSGSPGLKQLKIEYETLNRENKKEQLMWIVRRNKSWKLPVRQERRTPTDYDGYLSAENTKLTEWTWRGPSKLDGESWSHHGPEETVEYVVVTDTWNFVEGHLSEADMKKRHHYIPGSEYGHEEAPFYESDDEDWNYGLHLMMGDGDGEDHMDSSKGDDSDDSSSGHLTQGHEGYSPSEGVDNDL